MRMKFKKTVEYFVVSSWDVVWETTSLVGLFNEFESEISIWMIKCTAKVCIIYFKQVITLLKLKKTLEKIYSTMSLTAWPPSFNIMFLNWSLWTNKNQAAKTGNLSLHTINIYSYISSLNIQQHYKSKEVLGHNFQRV